jgi:hypothetical protein
MSAALELFQAKADIEAAHAAVREAQQRYRDAVAVFIDQCAPNGIPDEHIEGRALVHNVIGRGVIVIADDWHECDTDTLDRAITFMPGERAITHRGSL